jgi:hypothetical protein
LLRAQEQEEGGEWRTDDCGTEAARKPIQSMTSVKASSRVIPDGVSVREGISAISLSEEKRKKTIEPGNSTELISLSSFP